jgi:hypothetical protein
MQLSLDKLRTGFFESSLERLGVLALRTAAFPQLLVLDRAGGGRWHFRP